MTHETKHFIYFYLGAYASSMQLKWRAQAFWPHLLCPCHPMYNRRPSLP